MAMMVSQYDGELEGLLRQFGLWEKEFMGKKGLIKRDPFALLEVKPSPLKGPIPQAQKQQYLESLHQLEEKLRQAAYLDRPFKTQMEHGRTRSEIITDLKTKIEQWPASN
jgi:hypothetical protein